MELITVLMTVGLAGIGGLYYSCACSVTPGLRTESPLIATKKKAGGQKGAARIRNKAAKLPVMAETC
jgi:hypothetical protein